MGTRQRLLINQETFAANTQSMNIPADNIKDLQYGLLATEGGAGVATLAKMKAAFNEVLVTLGGHNIVKLLMEDLIAYNMLVLDNYPEVLLGGTTGFLCELGGIRLPLHITKGGRSVMTQVTFGTVTEAELDDVTLSLAYEYRDQPFPRHFAYQYEQKTGSPNQRWEGLARSGAALQGILIYNECEDMGVATSVMPEIAQLEMIVDDRSVYEWNIAVGKAHHSIYNQDDTTDGYGVDFGDGGWTNNLGFHYKYIDLPEAWRADKIAFITKSTCDAYLATDPSNGDCRLIGIYSEL